MTFFPKKAIYLFPVLWLVYLAFPVTDIWGRPLNERVLGLALIAVFVAAYLLSWWDLGPGRKRLIYYLAAETVITAYFTLYWAPEYLYMIFFVTPGAALIPIRWLFRTFSVLLAGLTGLYIFFRASSMSPGELLNLVPAMIVGIIAPLAIRVSIRSRELKGQLVQANEEIARLSKMEERQRISRNLHDTLGHTLSLIALKSELVEKLALKRPEQAAQEAKDIQMTARAALKQVRELVSDMASVTVQEELGNAKRILAAAGIELTVRQPEEPAELEPFAENVLGMCLRESVTNVVKHSQASLCTITLQPEAHQFKLIISDDGTGLGESGVWSQGSGLRGMKERLGLINGQLDMSSPPGGGVSVCLTVPRVIRNLSAGVNAQ
ncbi:sensor histidine kinase [Paenibacillus pinistramenti]|uniref:sensor histidine kinase n=1 Tax=Paenibacillus pinistramenti TaxID=1768003 RepID=UPI00110867C7|nr:sensor histidine kinase [Paenibacillus pinistramenti]